MTINNRIIIADEGCKIRRKSHNCGFFSSSTILPSEDADSFEEFTFEEVDLILLNEWKEKEYSKRLSKVIHEKYSLDDEAALNADFNTVPMLEDETVINNIVDEYLKYQDYRKECKERIKLELSKITEIPEYGEEI